jgi:hypothetical protein
MLTPYVRVIRTLWFAHFVRAGAAFSKENFTAYFAAHADKDLGGVSKSDVWREGAGVGEATRDVNARAVGRQRARTPGSTVWMEGAPVLVEI